MSELSLQADVFIRVLEQSAFLFADPAAAEDLPVPSGDLVVARLRYDGANTGSFELVMTRSGVHELAASSLGSAPDDDAADSLADDALGELLNVVAAHYLTEAFGVGADHRIGPPSVTPLDSAGWEALLASSDTELFLIDDGAAAFAVHRGEVTA